MEADTFSSFVAEAARVLLTMCQRQRFTLAKGPQMVTLDLVNDMLSVSYAGYLACFMAQWNWQKVRDIIGATLDYSLLDDTYREINMYKISSIVHFLENNNVERAVLSFYKMREEMDDFHNLHETRTMARAIEKEFTTLFGTVTWEEVSFHGIFCPRLLALATVASEIETFTKSNASKNEHQIHQQEDQEQDAGLAQLDNRPPAQGQGG